MLDALKRSALVDSDKPFPPPWMRWLILPGLLGPVFVTAFIFLDQWAHDEARCPYVPGETRVLAPEVSVREDHRQCMGNAEDHRFSVIRGTQQTLLGNRRFPAEAFAPGHYEWQARLDKDEVHVHVKNAGHDDADFREGTPEERKH